MTGGRSAAVSSTASAAFTSRLTSASDRCRLPTLVSGNSLAIDTSSRTECSSLAETSRWASSTASLT